MHGQQNINYIYKHLLVMRSKEPSRRRYTPVLPKGIDAMPGVKQAIVV